jgi:hypothetical protein
MRSATPGNNLPNRKNYYANSPFCCYIIVTKGNYEQSGYPDKEVMQQGLSKKTTLIHTNPPFNHWELNKNLSPKSGG